MEDKKILNQDHTDKHPGRCMKRDTFQRIGHVGYPKETAIIVAISCSSGDTCYIWSFDALWLIWCCCPRDWAYYYVFLLLCSYLSVCFGIEFVCYIFEWKYSCLGSNLQSEA